MIVKCLIYKGWLQIIIYITVCDNTEFINMQKRLNTDFLGTTISHCDHESNLYVCHCNYNGYKSILYYQWLMHVTVTIMSIKLYFTISYLCMLL
jgi:hypothetical protein